MSLFNLPDYHRTPAEMLIENLRVQKAVPASAWIWKRADWMLENTWIPGLATMVYILFLYFGTKFMKNREAYDLRTPLVLWNFALACVLPRLLLCRLVLTW
jgi:hypothetical protein